MRLLINKLYLESGEQIDKHTRAHLRKEANRMHCPVLVYAHDGVIIETVHPTIDTQLVNGPVVDMQDSAAERDFWDNTILSQANPRIRR